MSVPTIDVNTVREPGRYFVYALVTRIDGTTIQVTPNAPPPLLPPRGDVLAALAMPIGSRTSLRCDVPENLQGEMFNWFNQDYVLLVVQFDGRSFTVEEAIAQ